MSILPQSHPTWCDVDRCRAFTDALGQHRSAPFDYYAGDLLISFTVFKSEVAWETDTFLTAVIAFDGYLSTVVPEASFTIGLDDADRLAAFLTRTVEVARGATG